MSQLVNLCFQRLIISRVMISQCIYRNSSCKIKIFFALCIIKITAVSMIKHNWKTIICMQNILFRMIHLIIHAHHNISLHLLLK